MTLSFKRTLRPSWAGLLLAGVLVVGGISPDARAGADRILLRLKFAQGQSFRYRMVSEVSVPVPVTQDVPPQAPKKRGRKVKAPPAPAAPPAMLQTYLLDTTSVVRQTVQKLLDSGGAQVLIEVERQERMLNGRPQDPIPTPATVTSFDTLGRVIQLKGDQPGGLGRLFSSASSLGQFLPEQAVEPGDSWTYPFHLEGVSEGGTIKTSFLGFARIGPYRVAKLHSIITMPIKADAGVISGAAEATGTMLTGTGSFQVDTDVAPKDGFVVRNAATGTLALHATPKPGSIKKTDPYVKGVSMNVKISMSMTLIS